MVYENPKNPSIRNAWWLGPIRILTSSERAAELLRMPVRLLIKETFSGIGFGKVLEMLMPEIQKVSPTVYNFLLPYKYPRFGFVVPVLVAKGAYYVFLFNKYIITKWWDHMTPREPLSQIFFWQTDTLPPPPQVVGGVCFDTTRKRWYAHPVLSIEEGLKRAFNYTGMKFFSFLRTELSVGIEYPLTGAWRGILHYCNVPKYNNTATRSNMYKGVINTTFACFIIGDPSSSSYGNVVMTNVVLPFATDGTRLFRRLEFVLDHGDLKSDSPNAGKFVKAICTWVNTDDSLVTEVWGSSDMSENTAVGFTAQQQLDQAALIMIITVSLYSHAIVHWWANGAALVDKDLWPQQLGSSNITNWMNTQAIYLSWLFMGDQLSAVESILVRNNAQGLPLHFPTTPGTAQDNIWLVCGRRSKFHKMGGNGRKFLHDYMQANFPQLLDPALQKSSVNEGTNIDCILAATIWHNSEHYFANKYFPLFGQPNCVILQTDVSGLIRNLIAPVKYILAKLRCKQYKDPVSQGLYQACVGVEKDFANNALCIGCAF